MMWVIPKGRDKDVLDAMRRERDEARDRVSLLETSLRDAQDLYDRIKARAERAEARVEELEAALEDDASA